jgi:predicted O-methyltransferase YrrM
MKETDVLTRVREDTADLPLAEMQIPPEQGRLLYFFVKLLNAERALEVGVFTGYSALWTALALTENGLLVACDISTEWTETARKHWEAAGVSDRIDLRVGPALDTLRGLIADGQRNSFDLAFLDADKENYVGYYDCIVDLIRPGGVIMIDNILREGEVLDKDNKDAGTMAIQELNKRILNDSRVVHALLPMADGLTLVTKL